jgi:hypothetical protein
LQGRTSGNFFALPGSAFIAPLALEVMMAAISTLALFFGLAWHNQPGRHSEPAGPGGDKQTKGHQS